MGPLDASHGSVDIMHAIRFIGVAKVVLVENAGKPMRTPRVFSEYGAPISFVLIRQ